MDAVEFIGQNVAGPGIDPTELEPNYDASGRFLHLMSTTASTTTAAHLECHLNCECALCERCTNRRVQRGVQFKLKVKKCPGKGFGVFAAEPIPMGHFVVEYMGEVIGQEEAERRLANQRPNEHNYLFTIREYIAGQCQYTFIDGCNKGNISRFINHSCDPNLKLQVIRMGRPSPSLAMFAARDIAEGEELAYSYGFLSNPDGTAPLSVKSCLCSAASCKGRLPSANAI